MRAPPPNHKPPHGWCPTCHQGRDDHLEPQHTDDKHTAPQAVHVVERHCDCGGGANWGGARAHRRNKISAICHNHRSVARLQTRTQRHMQFGRAIWHPYSRSDLVLTGVQGGCVGRGAGAGAMKVRCAASERINLFSADSVSPVAKWLPIADLTCVSGCCAAGPRPPPC